MGAKSCPNLGISVRGTPAVALGRGASSHWGGSRIDSKGLGGCGHEEQELVKAGASCRRPVLTSCCWRDHPLLWQVQPGLGNKWRRSRSRKCQSSSSVVPGCRLLGPPTPLPAALPTPGPPVPWESVSGGIIQAVTDLGHPGRSLLVRWGTFYCHRH